MQALDGVLEPGAARLGLKAEALLPPPGRRLRAEYGIVEESAPLGGGCAGGYVSGGGLKGLIAASAPSTSRSAYSTKCRIRA